MNKLLVSVALVAGLAAGSAQAADLKMIKKAPAVAAAPASPCDVGFGTAFTTDYVLRGISQSNRDPAVQGYFEPSCALAEWVKVYAGLWGSSLWTGAANAEFDLYGGFRFSWGNFGLDVGYVQYYYPGGSANAFFDYGEIYAKPSYKFNDWLSVGAFIYYAPDVNQSSTHATYYGANATVTLPQFLPFGIGMAVSAEVGRQQLEAAFGNSWTTWNAGVIFNYKALTLDLRYYDTDLDPTVDVVQCVNAVGTTVCDSAFVATLKFDTSFSALK